MAFTGYGSLSHAEPLMHCPTPLRTIAINNNACANQWLSDLIQELGCSLEIQYFDVTGARRHRLFMDGKAEILIGMARTPEREKQIQFSRPIAEHRMILLARATSVIPPDMQWCDITMNSLSVIVPANGEYGEKVTALRQGSTCVKNTQTATLGPEQSLRMLQANRADMSIVPESWYENLNVNQKRPFKKINLILWKDQSALALRGLPNSFIDRINDAIERRLSAGNTPCNLPLPTADTDTDTDTKNNIAQ